MLPTMPDISFKKLFDYTLPQNLIANEPLQKRDNSKLLIVDRETGKISHYHFYNLAKFLSKNDVLVLNQSKVFPARLFGKKETGGMVEILLISQLTQNTWKAISKPGLPIGKIVYFSREVSAKVIQKDKTGEITIVFTYPQKTFFEALDTIGSTPIPGYIHTTMSERELRKRYQTVYAKDTGSAAAPTAGLHFTSQLLDGLKAKGIQIEYITLHVGLGTFQGLREEHFQTKSLHMEYYSISKDVADRLSQAKQQQKRIIAVGTTTMRTLETVTLDTGKLVEQSGDTTLFIYPPYRFRFVDSMITNFHLPESSLLMLISAFGAYPNSSHEFKNFSSSLLGKAYQEAIKNSYRFFSFGDAMWIV